MHYTIFVYKHGQSAPITPYTFDTITDADATFTKATAPGTNVTMVAWHPVDRSHLVTIRRSHDGVEV